MSNPFLNPKNEQVNLSNGQAIIDVGQITVSSLTENKPVKSLTGTLINGDILAASEIDFGGVINMSNSTQVTVPTVASENSSNDAASTSFVHTLVDGSLGGNMTFSGGGGIGYHSVSSSVDSLTYDKSALFENVSSFDLGGKSISTANNIQCDNILTNNGLTTINNSTLKSSILDATSLKMNNITQFTQLSSDLLTFDEGAQFINNIKISGMEISTDQSTTKYENQNITDPISLNITTPNVYASGNITAASFIKTNGTSSQFLKADGSVDSSRISVVDTNIAIGTGSLIANTSGVYNMALGQDALNANTIGNYNTAVGGAALYKNIDGSNNLAIGVSALQNNTYGLRNVAVGVVGLYENTNGNDNVAIGENALRNNTEGSGNTSCGVQCIQTNTTGSFNTGLGYQADVVSDNLTNATAIGYNAKVSSSNTIQLGNTGVNMINTSAEITAGGFIKSGGTNIQYLMGDGSTLTQSANSGNSNFYLYNSGTSQSPTPPSGFITYNNATQSSATMIYINHLTRDNIDIEVYFKQITTVTDVYIQDENSSANFIQFNITATPTITPEAQVAIPVLVRGTPGTTDFANGHNVIISFFTNGLEVDTRLSDLETNTQFQTIVSGNTNFSSGITIGNNYITTTQTVFNDSTQLVPKTYVDTAIGIGTNNTTERWVNSYIGSDVNSGSVLKPLATINAGFGNSAAYPLKLNIRGTFTTLQTLTGTNSNLQITTTDGWEAQQSTLSTTVITSGALTRLKMSGFTISTGTLAVLTIGDTLGRHAFSNMQFVSSNATPITFNAGFTNWCDFQDCDFSGLVSSGTASPITLPNLTGTAILRLYNCGVINLITGTGWLVYISGNTVLTTSGTTTPPTNLASGTIIQLPFNSFNAVLTSSPTWSALPVGNYINMIAAGLSTTGLIGTPTLGCCVIKIATGYQVVSLGYNQLPSSINVLNGVSLSYDTYVRTKGAVGWVVVDQSAYLPLAGGTMAGTINTNNNLITGLQRLTFNTSSTAIGSSAGLTSQGTNSVAVGSGCGQTSQGNESLAIGYNSGQSNQLGSAVAVGRGCGQTSQGALCVALGNVAGTTSQSTASIAIGNQAGATTQGGASESCVAIGNFTANDNQGGFSVAIGKEAGRYTQGSNCIAIGNQSGKNSQSSNSIVLNASGAVLDSTTTGLFIKPVRNFTNNNTVLYNSTSGELTYSANPTLTSIAGDLSLVSSTSAYPSLITKSITAGSGITITDTANNLTIASDVLELQSINSFFMGIMFQNGSGLLTNMSNSLWTATGSSSSAASSYAVTNNFTRQLCCALWTTTALADGASCGYISTATTGIQVSIGFQFGLLSALGIADSAYNANNCQNFWGLWNVATGIVLNQSTQLSVQRNMICFGSNTTDANICIYTAGASSTVKQVDLGANFPANRPSGALSTNFYRFSFYWDGTKIYYKAINTTLNITVQGSFTPLTTDIPATTISLYPQCVRVMGTPQSNGQARLQVQRFGVFY